MTIMLNVWCSAWTNCSNSLQDNCTFDDTVAEALQPSTRWNWFRDYNAIQSSYNEGVDSMRHLCTNIYPGTSSTIKWFDFYARKQLLLSARLSHRNSVCPSVCHTGGSGKNGAS